MNEAQLVRWWNDVLASLVSDEILTREQAEQAELRISDDPSLRKTPRNYAATTMGLAGNPWGPVEVHRDLLVRSPRKVIAVCLHELGHVLDGAGLGAAENAPDDPEIRADWLVEQVFGVRLVYDPKDLVQTLGSGIPRPAGLQ